MPREPGGLASASTHLLVLFGGLEPSGTDAQAFLLTHLHRRLFCGFAVAAAFQLPSIEHQVVQGRMALEDVGLQRQHSRRSVHPHPGLSAAAPSHLPHGGRRRPGCCIPASTNF
eukprot:scaffold1254_cov251-Pinguiococcus_pyrenoidosus.AAC.11